MVKFIAGIIAALGVFTEAEAYEFPHKDEGMGPYPDWYTSSFLNDELREKVIEHGYIPTKGIPYKIFAFGPYEPPKFSKQAEIFPEETEFNYFDYENADESVKRISEKWEKLGIHGAYRAYRDLRPWSYKADFWRWMILWE